MGGNTADLTETQKKILQFLEEAGEAEAQTICESLRIDQAELQRNIAPLRHMEKLRGANRDGRIVLMLWDSPGGTR
jgi:DNA-binding MarR family transcriptional regulator